MSITFEQAKTVLFLFLFEPVYICMQLRWNYWLNLLCNIEKKICSTHDVAIYDTELTRMVCKSEISVLVKNINEMGNEKWSAIRDSGFKIISSCIGWRCIFIKICPLRMCKTLFSVLDVDHNFKLFLSA